MKLYKGGKDDSIILLFHDKDKIGVIINDNGENEETHKLIAREIYDKVIYLENKFQEDKNYMLVESESGHQMVVDEDYMILFTSSIVSPTYLDKDKVKIVKDNIRFTAAMDLSNKKIKEELAKRGNH